MYIRVFQTETFFLKKGLLTVIYILFLNDYDMEYSEEISHALQKSKIHIWDNVTVEKHGKTYSGILMPKSQGKSDTLIIKLENGYNIGIEFDHDTKIKHEDTEKKTPQRSGKKIIEKLGKDESKPTISIIATGGTIASRVDYQSGAVKPLESVEEILSAVPELANIANINYRTLFQLSSEDMEAEHWIKLAQHIKNEIEEFGSDGIIITQGTDTIHYTSAALSFMLQDIGVPVIIVGSQRSSDRPSSDAAMNLICAAHFIKKTDFAGVAVCMHGSANDDFCFVHPGLHVKKMHTSRRDAFKSIDVVPYAKVDQNGTVEFLSDYQKRSEKKINIIDRFDKNIALIKTYPGFRGEMLEGYRGIVLEGTGLGHAPITATDQFTEGHPKLLQIIKNLTTKGTIIVMTSQCPYGKVNLDVYSIGRKLQEAGVVPLAMTPEAAFVKLGWCLGHTHDAEQVKKMLLTDYLGEFAKRIDTRAFE